MGPRHHQVRDERLSLKISFDSVRSWRTQRRGQLRTECPHPSIDATSRFRTRLLLANFVAKLFAVLPTRNYRIREIGISLGVSNIVLQQSRPFSDITRRAQHVRFRGEAVVPQTSAEVRV